MSSVPEARAVLGVDAHDIRLAASGNPEALRRYSHLGASNRLAWHAMRIAILSFGSRGDVQPFVTFGKGF